MTKSARATLLLLLLALGMNHLVLGMLWINSYTQPSPVLVAFGLYLMALLASLFSTTDLRLPWPVAAFNLAISFTVPALVLAQLPHSAYSANGSYETWFIAAVSLVLAITSVRGFTWIGWLGIGYLWIIVVAWGGLTAITTTGLIGALLMVLTAAAFGRGLRSTTTAAEEYYREAAELRAKVARNTSGREARQQMIQSVMFTGLPLLERIRNNHGKLSDDDRLETKLLEARFRDELQGRQLLSDGVRLAVREARKRGVDVSFSDKGGLDTISDSDLSALHNSIIQALNSTQTGKIHISAPTGEPYRVAITAQRPDATGPDLWLRLS